MMKFVFHIIMLCICLSASRSYGMDPIVFQYTGLSEDQTPSILVENIPVLKQEDCLYPITLTVTRPIQITVGNETKEIKIDRLSKDMRIPIDVVLPNETKHYFLQTLPDMFPDITVMNTTHQKGYVLISLHGLLLYDPSYSFILDMDGHIIFYRGNPQVNQSMFHLKKVVLSSGKVRYITHVQSGWSLDNSYVIGYHLIMDEQFREIDRVTILKTEKHEALLADEHDILMLDDGHYIVTGQDVIETRLSDEKKSLITHTVIQEIKDGHVIWDWDSKDYPELRAACIEKCPEVYDYNADYIHANSLFIDPKDNHLLVSSASGYYVMKLNRQSGDILWILGGLLNQFQMPKEGEFIRQHDIHLTVDGRLVMFDNHIANRWSQDIAYRPIPLENGESRILILGLDEVQKRVTSVETIPLHLWANFMGSARQVDEKRWFVGCGSADDCTARMIDSDGHVLWHMKAQPPYKMFRAYYYDKLF